MGNIERGKAWSDFLGQDQTLTLCFVCVCVCVCLLNKKEGFFPAKSPARVVIYIFKERKCST